MKQALLILTCIVSLNTFAQKIYIADTAFKTDIGYGGAPASSMCTSCAWAGQDMDHDDGWWLAEDFTVPAGATYSIDSVITYGYERYSSKTSTFNAAYLLVYADGPPGAGGTVIWGDSVTNILANTAFTGIYRVPSAYPNDTSRPLMSLSLYLTPAPVLTAGTYWVAWSANGSSSHFVDGSFKVLPGGINPSGQNGLQYNNYILAWEPCDDGHRYGFNFIVVASQVSGISEVNKPKSFRLQNTPNPFTESATISFELAEISQGKLAVYNTIGQCVATLMDGMIDAGKHEITFKPNQLPNGLYSCVLSTAFGSEHKQMLLMK